MEKPKFTPLPRKEHPYDALCRAIKIGNVAALSKAEGGEGEG